VNDHDAIDAINAVLDQWFKGESGPLESLYRIARISGENTIEHKESK
jgi:hypothetical protein